MQKFVTSGGTNNGNKLPTNHNAIYISSQNRSTSTDMASASSSATPSFSFPLSKSLSQPAKVQISGYLKKKRNKVGGWRKMWFVLQNQLLLSYSSKDDYEKKLVSFKDCLNLVPGTVVRPLGGFRFTIETTSDILYTFRCDDSKTCTQWMTALVESLSMKIPFKDRLGYSQKFQNISMENIRSTPSHKKPIRFSYSCDSISRSKTVKTPRIPIAHATARILERNGITATDLNQITLANLPTAAISNHNKSTGNHHHQQHHHYGNNERARNFRLHKENVSSTSASASASASTSTSAAAMATALTTATASMDQSNQVCRINQMFNRNKSRARNEKSFIDDDNKVESKSESALNDKQKDLFCGNHLESSNSISVIPSNISDIDKRIIRTKTHKKPNESGEKFNAKLQYLLDFIGSDKSHNCEKILKKMDSGEKNNENKKHITDLNQNKMVSRNDKKTGDNCAGGNNGEYLIRCDNSKGIFNEDDKKVCESSQSMRPIEEQIQKLSLRGSYRNSTVDGGIQNIISTESIRSITTQEITKEKEKSPSKEYIHDTCVSSSAASTSSSDGKTSPSGYSSGCCPDGSCGSTTASGSGNSSGNVCISNTNDNITTFYTKLLATSSNNVGLHQLNHRQSPSSSSSHHSEEDELTHNDNQNEPIYAVVDLKNKYARRAKIRQDMEREIEQRPNSLQVVTSDYEEVLNFSSEYLDLGDEQEDDDDDDDENGKGDFVKVFGCRRIRSRDEDENENIYEPINIPERSIYHNPNDNQQSQNQQNRHALWKYFPRINIEALIEMTKHKKKEVMDVKCDQHSPFSDIRRKLGNHRKSIKIRMKKFYTRDPQAVTRNPNIVPFVSTKAEERNAFSDYELESRGSGDGATTSDNSLKSDDPNKPLSTFVFGEIDKYRRGEKQFFGSLSRLKKTRASLCLDDATTEANRKKLLLAPKNLMFQQELGKEVIRRTGGIKKSMCHSKFYD